MVDNPRLLPLLLLNAEGGSAVEGITRMQKLVFLVQRSEGEKDIGEYEFIPDDYGPFSKQLYDDLDQLVRNGYVKRKNERTPAGNNKQVYEITDKGRTYLEVLDSSGEFEEEAPLDTIEKIKEEYNDLPLLKLLKNVYNEYPEMAVNSKLDLI